MIDGILRLHTTVFPELRDICAQVCVTPLFLQQSAQIGHIPLPPMAAVRGMGKEQDCRHGNAVFPVGSYL